ncbi:ATP-binding protein [Rhodococcus sp. H36-A4]|uniref:ATP-binding protein n=1 Tax=unclassified Rhodococcus (in: high G+C Gram-positive bacteria) TaxID=192944 RepID=UPI000A0E6901|nr:MULTISPECIES: ATP-binding protein [unclassified Rhodococcus (in: high G+C Gram-positive bacteria)]MCZ4080288.1 ATP-binding protein [Rhodococcus sp. H36-A4]ORI21123.1 ATP-binding protein [Rhodococcus sp. 1168]
MRELEIVGTVEAPPDPSLASSIGLHHTLATALADLIDNSIDARARHILVRFLQRGTSVTGVRVIDDGVGMDSETIDGAMTFGRRREYEPRALGYFGVGMKAASLSQASTLVVWSRAESSSAQGRRIDRDAPHRVSTISTEQAELELARAYPRFPFDTGTIVEWQGITTFLRSSDADEQTSWLEQTKQEIADHIGIVFHRLLSRGEMSISLDTFDVEGLGAGFRTPIDPIDPFATPRTGAAGYPRTLPVELDGVTLAVTAHIWPARSSLPQFRLYGAPGRDHQGLYFYRSDRLLQTGGWNGIVLPRPDYGLARVIVDLDPAVSQHLAINPEKAGVTVDATLTAALESALASGGLLSAAEVAVRSARSRQSRPVEIVEPNKGLPEDLLDAFADSFEFSEFQDQVDIGWRALSRDKFFEVDLKCRTLWINARFRRELLGHRSYNSTDAPVLKTLLYLLVHQMFQGARDSHSSKQAEQMQVWQDVLIAALSARRLQEKDKL